MRHCTEQTRAADEHTRRQTDGPLTRRHHHAALSLPVCPTAPLSWAVLCCAAPTASCVCVCVAVLTRVESRLVHEAQSLGFGLVVQRLHLRADIAGGEEVLAVLQAHSARSHVVDVRQQRHGQVVRADECVQRGCVGALAVDVVRDGGDIGAAGRGQAVDDLVRLGDSARGERQMVAERGQVVHERRTHQTAAQHQDTALSAGGGRRGGHVDRWKSMGGWSAGEHQTRSQNLRSKYADGRECVLGWRWSR